MFDFALQEFDFVRREVEQAIDAGVEVGFGVGEFVRLAGDSGAVFGEVGGRRIRSPAARIGKQSGELFGFAVQMVGGVSKLRVSGDPFQRMARPQLR